MVIDTEIPKEDEYKDMNPESGNCNEIEMVSVSDEPDFSPLEFLVNNDCMIQGELISKDGNIFEFEFNDLGSANPSDASAQRPHLVSFRYEFFGVSNFRIKDRLKFKFTKFEDCSCRNYRKIGFYTGDGKVKCSFNYRYVLMSCL